VTGTAVQASRAAPTAGRALRVLELVASEPMRPWKLAEVQRRLGYSHGNLHAIAATLVAMGYLRRDEGSRGYLLGPAVFGLGSAARQAYSVVDAAESELRDLARALGTEADEILVVARYGPELPEGEGVRVGLRVPLTPPMGSTLMAWASREELDRYLGTAEASVPGEQLDRLRGALDTVRRRGYSVHVFTAPRRALGEAASRAVHEGVDEDRAELAALAHELASSDYLSADPSSSPMGDGVQLSAPVFGSTGAVELSVGVVFGAGSVVRETVMGAPEALLGAARTITAAIGGRPPHDPDAG